jgi:hypothetical protein
MNKTTLSLLIVGLLLAVGCSKSLKEEDLVGSWEGLGGNITFIENGKAESYDADGKKDTEWTWKITGEEVHLFLENGTTDAIGKIKSTGNLFWSAHNEDGQLVYQSEQETFGFSLIKVK